MGCSIISPRTYPNSLFSSKKQITQVLLWKVANKVSSLNNLIQRREYIYRIEKLRRNWDENIDLISELNSIMEKLQYHRSKYQVVPQEFMEDTNSSLFPQSAPLILNNEEWAYFINALDENNLDEGLKRLYSKKPENLTNLF